MSQKKRVAVVPESPLSNTSYPVYDLDAALGGLQAAGPSVENDPLAAFEVEDKIMEFLPRCLR
jgi:hypothetical protein